VHQFEALCGQGERNEKSRAGFARDVAMRVNRFVLALAGFGVLAALTWSTISDEKIRLATLAVLALFALKTVLRRKDVMHPVSEDGGQEESATGDRPTRADS
jgi:hypothetical protein